MGTPLGGGAVRLTWEINWIQRSTNSTEGESMYQVMIKGVLRHSTTPNKKHKYYPRLD